MSPARQAPPSPAPADDRAPRARELVRASIADGVELRRAFGEAMEERILEAADRVHACLAAGGKVLLFGNGGSAADAQHLAAEFVNRFVGERPALAALALTVDSSALTSIGNDRSFEELFSRQLEALGRPGDVAIGISTSGSSPNVVRALAVARERGLVTIGLTGRGGGAAAELCDVLIDVPGTRVVARIQELHLTAGHILCELVDHRLAHERGDG